MHLGRVLRKIAWIAGIIILVCVVLILIALAPTEDLPSFIRHKTRALTTRRFDSTPERLKRGRYITQTVAHCFACHSPREDHPAHHGSFVPGQDAKGQFGTWGPYHLAVPNLTPDQGTGIGNWTDDQLARAMREGIGHDGRVLTTMMPYQWFSRMSDEDVASIIVYLRSLPPVHNPLPRMRLPLILRLLDPSYPEPITSSVPQPDLSDPVRRGAYYIALGKCFDCHTAQNWRGAPIPGLEFAGGNWFPDGEVSAPNLTPDPSGISYYDEAMFIQVMRTGKVGGVRELHGPMPWWEVGHMTDEDLKAMFAYLRTLRPVKHRVDNDEPRRYCTVCRRKHRGGALN